MKIHKSSTRTFRNIWRSFLAPVAVWAVLFAVLTGNGGARPFVYENAFELQADGDFDGDGRRDLIIVDKGSGSYRIAYQLAPGVFTWTSARASGISGAAGLAIGKLSSTTNDSLAVTGPDANRINVLDATNTSTASQPSSVFISSLGPSLAVAIDIGGVGNTLLDDLYVASIYNGLAPSRETLVRDPTSAILADNSLTYLRDRGNAILLHTNRAPFLALMERNTAVNTDRFDIFSTSTGTALLTASAVAARLPEPRDYVTGQFVSTNPYTQFLLYAPSASNFDEYQVIEPTLGAYSLAYSNTFSLTNTVERLFVLPGTNGLRLLAIDVSETWMTVYAFDGLHAPSPVQALNADAGEHFTGAGVYGDGGFTAYSARSGQTVSTRFKQWNWNGSGYTSGASGDLPRINPYSASGNVMQFEFEPFITNNPVLLRLNSAGDWSSAPALSLGSISVKTESFGSSSQGLINPTTASLGAAHPLAAFALANQFSNMLSLFSFAAPAGDRVSDVTISPDPGTYPTSVRIQFVAQNSTDNIYYRIGSGTWGLWTGSSSLWLFTNATVQYYGQPGGGPAKSAIKTASYSFSQGPATLDSKGDGIPDYVKLALGLPVTGGADSDGDGYSDLEELIHGTNPLDAASVPTNFPHLDDQAVFDLNLTPFPWDGFSNSVSLCLTGAVLRAYDLQGSLLAENTLSNSYPTVVLSNILIVPDNRLVSYATEQHFPILTTNPDNLIGRELVGVLPLPPAVLPAVSYVYGGGNLAIEASNWVASASNAFNHLPRLAVTNSLSVNRTLEALLFELKTALLLGARGTNWWTNLTLFPFRPADAGRVNPDQVTLLSLESETGFQPGYKLQTMCNTISNVVETSANPDIASLRAVVRDIYRIDSVYNNSNPATYILAVDEIRHFLWSGSMDSAYTTHAVTAAQFTQASNGVAEVLAAVSPRPMTNVTLLIRSDTFSGPCRLLDLSSATATFALQDPSGVPFVFPSSFNLVPGSQVQIFGYTDATNPACSYPAIEVISAGLSSIPVASDSDSDGNLLVDTWEKQFFGGLGSANPFADTDGDGYSNLQEMLDGSDPRDYYGRPSGPPVAFGPPVLNLVTLGSQVEIHFQWPAAYISFFNFGVQETPDLSTPFATLPAPAPVNVSGDEFKITVTLPPTVQHYYFLTVSLR